MLVEGQPVPSRRPSARGLRCALIAAATALLLVAASATAEAQRYRRGREPYDGHTRVRVYFVPYGLYVGAGLVATRILDQSGGQELLDHGGGLTVYGGLRLSQRLALELGWLATFHDPDETDGFGADTDYLVLNAFTGDAKIYLSPEGQRAELYLQGGIGLYLLDSNHFGTESTGTGFQGGGGVDFHLGPHLDLGLRALYRGIAMGPPRSDENDTFISSVGGEANLTLHF